MPFIIDACISVLSLATPFLVISIDSFNRSENFLSMVFIYTIIYTGTFFIMKVYKNMWRYSGVEEILRCIIASIAANFLFYILTQLLSMNSHLYVYLTAFSISSFLAISARIIYRAIHLIDKNRNDRLEMHVNAMIIGANDTTNAILSEIKSNSRNHYLIKCILDDDKSKIGRVINNVSVVGDTSKIVEMAEKYNVEEIIISDSSLTAESKRNIYNNVSKIKCKVKILPAVYSMIENESNSDLIGRLRYVNMNDLLGRQPVILDCELSKDNLKGKVILITGGGGSIGSELCRQISTCGPEKLIILDSYENNAYEIQQELIRKFGSKLNMVIEIASVRDIKKLEKLFLLHNIDIVFHAAAHKHVPLMEKNPEEAIKNNIIGTYNMTLMADKYRVKKFVLISTDKAVNPTNVMGATKKISELIIQSFNKHSSTDFVAVRFGNVLSSNGSVIPLFLDQINTGGPVTITHEEITRYFMTIPEAVKLVLKAAAIANGGEIFVLDMGNPIKIKDLAYQLILLFGLTPDVDIRIKYTGLRPGEKLYEELINEDCEQAKTKIDKILIEKPTEIDESKLLEGIKLLEEAADNMDLEAELTLIEKLVPTYKRTPNVKVVD